MIGVDPGSCTPFILELTVSGSRLDPQTAAVTITGAGPAGRADRRLPPARRRPTVASTAACAAPTRRSRADHRPGTCSAHAGAPSRQRRSGGARRLRRCQLRPQLRTLRLRTPWDLGADEVPGSRSISGGGRGHRLPSALADDDARFAAECLEEAAMDDSVRHEPREFLRAAGLGALGTVAAGGVAGSPAGGVPPRRPRRPPRRWRWPPRTATSPCRAARPTRCTSSGSSRSTPTPPSSQLSATYKGHAQHTAPTLDFKQDDDIKITLTNLGLVQRPDLDRLAHHPLARLRPAVAAQRRRARGVGRRADRQAADVLLPPAPRGHVHVPLPLRGRRARPDGHDRDRLRPARCRTARRRSGQDVHEVRLQRRRRLDRVRPPLRDPAERDLDERLPRRRPGHPGDHRDRLRPAVVHPQRALLPADDPAERRRADRAPGIDDAEPELRRRDDTASRTRR